MATHVASPIGTWHHEPAAAEAALAATGWLAVAVLIFLGVPYLGMRAGLEAQLLLHPIDPEQVFVYLYTHHFVEGLAGLALIGLVGRPALRWLHGPGDVRAAARAIAIFTAVIAALAIAVDVVPVLLGAAPPRPGYPLVARNLVTIFLFQAVVVGLGEELLFRGAILGVLRRAFSRPLTLGFFQVSVAGVIAAVLFGLAHALYYDFAFWPITLAPDWIQVGYATALGVYYAALTERTGSLWGAIVSHNLSDVIYVLALWWAAGL